jgi:hypothetical protein
VLVVVEDRDAHALAQLAFDVETLGRLDVLEVDATKRRLERGDDVDQLVRITLGKLDVEDVDAGELLEEAALALHHRLAGKRADVAEAEHSGSIGHHADQVGPRRVFGGHGGIVADLEAGIRHAWRIGEREIELVGQRLGRLHRDLAPDRQAVVFKCGLPQRLLRRRQLAGERPGFTHCGLALHPLLRARACAGFDPHRSKDAGAATTSRSTRRAWQPALLCGGQAVRGGLSGRRFAQRRATALVRSSS